MFQYSSIRLCVHKIIHAVIISPSQKPIPWTLGKVQGLYPLYPIYPCLPCIALLLLLQNMCVSLAAQISVLMNN